MKQQAFILDLDGTIADNSHRQFYLDRTPKDWSGFMAAIPGDRPKGTVLSVANCLHKVLGLEPILVTGRMERHRLATAQWLMQNSMWLGPCQLYMRPEDDHRPDHEVKKEIFQKFISPRWDVKLVFEDRASVVRMYRDLGLEVWQVADGEY